MSIIGIMIGGWHLTAFVRRPVLAEPDVEMSVSVDVPARQHLAIAESRIGCPNEFAGVIECPCRRSAKQQQAIEGCAEKVGSSIAIEIRNHRREEGARGCRRSGPVS
jgi:hypothetical protein